MAALGTLDWDALPVSELLTHLDRLETLRRRSTACAYDGAAAVDRRQEQELGGRSARILADVLRISPGGAKRRIHSGTQLAGRTTLTGQQVPPELPATAQAWHTGALDTAHLRTIQTFLRDLPDHVAPTDAVAAEAFLAEQAALLRPDQLNIDTLTFACKAHHALVKPGGWRTRKLEDGTTQWLPPPQLPLPGGTNTYHHPENMLPDDSGGARRFTA